MGRGTTTVEQVFNYLNRFVTCSPPVGSATLVSGPWGCGKTFAVNQFVAQLRESSKDQKVLYLSAYGARSTEELSRRLLVSTYPVLDNKGVRLMGTIAGALLGAVNFKLGHKDKDGNSASGGFDIGELMNALSPRSGTASPGTVIVVDDIERAAFTNPKELWGFVNSLIETPRARVVLVADEAKLDNDAYRDTKEKNVAQTFQLQVDPRNVVVAFVEAQADAVDTRTEFAVAAIRVHLDLVLDVFHLCGGRNLRVLQHALRGLVEILRAVDLTIVDNQFDRARLIGEGAAFLLLFHGGKLKPEELEDLDDALFVNAARQMRSMGGVRGDELKLSARAQLWDSLATPLYQLGVSLSVPMLPRDWWEAYMETGLPDNDALNEALAPRPTNSAWSRLAQWSFGFESDFVETLETVRRELQSMSVRSLGRIVVSVCNLFTAQSLGLIEDLDVDGIDQIGRAAAADLSSSELLDVDAVFRPHGAIRRYGSCSFDLCHDEATAFFAFCSDLHEGAEVGLIAEDADTVLALLSTDDGVGELLQSLGMGRDKTPKLASAKRGISPFPSIQAARFTSVLLGLPMPVQDRIFWILKNMSVRNEEELSRWLLDVRRLCLGAHPEGSYTRHFLVSRFRSIQWLSQEAEVPAN